MANRPEHFEIDRGAPLARRLLFAGLPGQGGGGFLRDRSGFARHATLTNMDPATAWVWDSTIGRWCLNLDGSNDYCVTPSIPHGIGTGDFTMTLWVNANDPTGSWDCLMAMLSYSPGVYFPGSAGGRFSIYWGGETSPVVYYSASTWYHVAFVRRAGIVSIYVNGRLIGTPTSIGTSMANGTLSIGASAAAGGEYFNGKIADALFAAEALDWALPALADPGNTLLEVAGRPLILPPRRRFFPAAAAEEEIVATGTATGSGAEARGIATVAVAATGTATGPGTEAAGIATVSITVVGRASGSGAEAAGIASAAIAASGKADGQQAQTAGLAAVLVTATGRAEGTGAEARGTASTGRQAAGRAEGPGAQAASQASVSVDASGAANGEGSGASGIAAVAVAASGRAEGRGAEAAGTASVALPVITASGRAQGGGSQAAGLAAVRVTAVGTAIGLPGLARGIARAIVTGYARAEGPGAEAWARAIIVTPSSASPGAYRPFSRVILAPSIWGNA